MDIEINGMNINYIDEGINNDKIILMIHGWASNAELFRSQINLLKSKYRVIAVNLPGHSKSDEPTTPYSVDDFARFVVDFLNKLNVKKVTLIGHSVGGRVIIKLMSYKTLQIEVDKIVLIDSAGIKPNIVAKKTLKSSCYKFLKAIFSIKLVKKICPKGIDFLKTKFGSEDYRNATPIMRDTLVKVVNEDLTDILECNDKDTLIIWGKNDTAVPVSDGQLMESKMKKSALVVIDNAAHFPFLEQQFIFNKIIASYFQVEVGN